MKRYIREFRESINISDADAFKCLQGLFPGKLNLNDIEYLQMKVSKTGLSLQDKGQRLGDIYSFKSILENFVLNSPAACLSASREPSEIRLLYPSSLSMDVGFPFSPHSTSLNTL